MPPCYAATSKMIYQSSSKTISGSMSSLAAMAGISLGESSSDISAYLADIVVTRDVLERIAKTPWKSSKLSRDTTLAQTLDKWWKWQTDTTQPDWKQIQLESIVGALGDKKKGYIRYENDSKSGLVLLTTEFEDPRISHDINVFLVNVLNDYVQDRMKSKAGKNSMFLEARTSEAKSDLERAEENYFEFRKNNLVRNAPLVSLQEERLQRDLETTRELYIQFYKQYELARIEEMKDAPALEVLEYPLVPRYPSSPNMKLFMAACFPAIFLFCLLFFYFLDFFWEKVRQHKLASKSHSV